MIAFLANLVFTSPWLLLGLLSLPALWLLLRVTPPAPKLIRFPATRFLEGLEPEQQTPSKTPLWLLILRMLILALVIFALAGPVYNPGTRLGGSGPLRLVIDNGWSSAQIWSEQIRAGEDLLARAAREGRAAVIHATAPQPGQKDPFGSGLTTAPEALALLRGLEPLPWEPDYRRLAELIREAPAETFETVWFADGLARPGFDGLAEVLKTQGPLTYVRPESTALPVVLGPGDRAAQREELKLTAPPAIAPGLPVGLQALSEDGRVLDYGSVTISPAELPLYAALDVPETLRGEVAQYRLTGNRGAAGVLLLDERFRRRAVGIVAGEQKAEDAPLADAGYYLRRALEPYGALHFGGVDSVLKQSPSMIILPDIGAMPVETMNALEEWVQGGGLLLRFAGPNMTGGDAGGGHLLPVPLRHEGRALQGALTWENPLSIAPFPEGSPFYGMPVPEDVTVRTQILPDETADLTGKVWASLQDGTPLITAAPLGQGFIALIHVTATPDWSDLPLSGLFVQILKRLSSISGLPPAQVMARSAAALDPVFVLDGFGRIQRPDATVKPIRLSGENGIPQIGPEHPPGLYGGGAVQMALNIGAQDLRLRTVEKLPPGVTPGLYGADYELDLRPHLLYAAAALLLLDWLIMTLMGISLTSFVMAKRQSRRSNPGPRAQGSGLLRSLWLLAMMATILMAASPAIAQTPDAKNLTYANGLYLAYIKTGDPAIDALSLQGLENLRQTLIDRTSAEPDGVAGLDPRADTLVFFPWIYWPVTGTQTPLSAEALNNVQHYLDHGGTILFDMRDGARGGGANAEALRQITAGLNIPPLQPLPEDHVLTKTFYLLKDFPGLHNAGDLWIERVSGEGRDGVSSVIIGANDWAGAWAAGRGAGAFMGGARQHELAMRAGVNVTMYALTGNYKADQVHVPHILERLDR